MGTDFKGLDRIGQIAINVHDLARAVTFYREALGIPFLFEVPGMAFFDCNGVRLMLGVPVGPEVDHPASILYYKVDGRWFPAASLSWPSPTSSLGCRPTSCGWRSSRIRTRMSWP